MFARCCVSFVTLLLAVALNANSAFAAGSVTVKYRAFPGGAEILPPEVVTGTLTTTAAEHLYRKKAAFEFLFWNVTGKLPLTSPKLSDDPATTGTFATAWYLQTGGGGGCTPNCSVATWAFSLDDDAVIANTTPIASVTPGGLWTAPSTTVSTDTTSTVTIAARKTLSVPLEYFQSWLELPNTAVSGSNLTSAPEGSAEAVAFYRSLPSKPPLPGPCPKGPGGHVIPCHY